MYNALLILTKIVGVGLKDNRLLLDGLWSFGCFAACLLEGVILCPVPWRWVDVGVLSRLGTLDRNGSRRGVVAGVVARDAEGVVVLDPGRLGEHRTPPNSRQVSMVVGWSNTKKEVVWHVIKTNTRKGGKYCCQ